jgi:Domain of unknown function (DUF4158)
MSIDDYPQNEKTCWEHLERIRQHDLRFQQCDSFQRQRLLKHLTKTAQALARSDALRQEAWRWLQEQRIVRPGPRTLRDLLTAAREEKPYWGRQLPSFHPFSLGPALRPHEMPGTAVLRVPKETSQPLESRLYMFRLILSQFVALVPVVGASAKDSSDR